MLLLTLLAAPVLAAVLTAFAGPDSASQRRLGLLLSFAIAGLGTALLWGQPAAVDIPWFTVWGSGATIHLSLASDGLSAWLVQLVTWLTPFAILGATGAVRERMRVFTTAVLAMEALMIGALLARDLAVFYICYEGMLVPMLVLISVFGGVERKAAAMRFFLYTMLGSVFLLVAIWWLAARLETFDMARIATGVATLSDGERGWLFWAFVLAFAVKVPVIPLHGWQASTYAETPGAAVALLAGAMAKVGVYGLIRLVLPIFPEESAAWAWLFIGLGVAATVGGALVAIVQDDAKRMIAYSSLSHLGLVVAGIFTFETAALQGAAVQMVAHGLSVAALFLLIGFLEARTRMYGLDDFGGLAARTPRLAVLFVAAALAAAGLPGTANFVGEFLLLLGLYQDQGPVVGLVVAAVAGLSVVLTVVYLLILIQRWFFGDRTPAAGDTITDLRPSEVLSVAPLLAAAFVLGCWATPITSTAGAAADAAARPAQLASAAATPAVEPAQPATTNPVTAP